MTFREYLKKIIKEKQEKINNLHERSKASNDVNELRPERIERCQDPAGTAG